MCNWFYFCIYLCSSIFMWCLLWTMVHGHFLALHFLLNIYVISVLAALFYCRSCFI
jgi:hypothetical protein